MEKNVTTDRIASEDNYFFDNDDMAVEDEVSSKEENNVITSDSLVIQEILKVTNIYGVAAVS